MEWRPKGCGGIREWEIERIFPPVNGVGAMCGNA
jgi:hypothetical protein